jgi:fibronectin-binding autotransporter adhesin
LESFDSARRYSVRFLLRAAVLFCACAVAAVAQTVTITQTFQSTSPTNWAFSTPNSSYTPQSGVMTDTSGNNWLELANNTQNEATAAVYTGNFSSTGASVYATFNYQMYGGSGGTTIGGDGITFFLYDASQTFSAGAYGGSMGYAQKTGINGLSGGYIGVGLDAYGNYSSASEGRVGGYNNTTGQVTESIAVRGPGSGTTGYSYLGGTSAHLGSGNTSTDIDSSTRPTATNTVQILLSATNQLTVTLAQGGSTPQTVLQMDLSGYARPDLLSFGFTAGTGSATDYMLINNLTVTTVTASKWIGGSSSWGSNTNWNPSVVPTNGSDILFDNSYVTSAQTIDTGANRTIRSMTFDAPFNYTINNNTITIDNGGVSGFSGIQVSQTHGTGVDTINSALSLNNDIHVTNNASGTLNLNGAIANGGHAITFDGTGTATNVAGVISGTGNITKNDSGTVTLSGANTFSGGTTLNSGTLNANSSTALGTGNITITGGTLGSTNSSSINNNVTLSGDAGMSGLTNAGTLTQAGANRTFNMLNATQSGAVKLSDSNTGHTLTVETDSGTSTISGVISNGGTSAGNVTKTGTGTLVLSGANTYTGTTTITAGTLTLGGSDRLANTSGLTIGANGTFNLNGNSQKVGTLTATGGSTIDFGSAGTGNTFVFGNYVAPTSGILTVNNWNSSTDTFASYGNITATSVGTIYLSGYGTAALGSVATTIYGNATLIQAATQNWTVWKGGNTTWNTTGNWTNGIPNSTSALADIGGNAAGTANPDLGGNRTLNGLRFDSAATQSYNLTGSTRTLTMSSATTSGIAFIQQQSSLDQTMSFTTLSLARNTMVDVTGAGNLTISAGITGTSNLVKDGTGGSLILSGNNSSWTGSLFVNAGTAQIQNANALGGGTGGTTVAAGGTLEVAGNITAVGNITISGTGDTGNGALRNASGTNTLSGTVTQSADATVSAAAGSLTITNGITGTNVDTTFAGAGNITVGAITTGTGGVIVNSTGTVTMNGAANTNSGNTTVNSGTLVLAKAASTTAIAGNLAINGGAVQLNAANQISNTSAVTLAGSGTLNLNGQAETLSQVTSSSATSTIAMGTGGAITINSVNGQNSSFSGILTGTASSSFNVNGTSKVYLSGNDSGFAGNVNVNGGTLNASGSNTALGTGNVAVASGANLQLQGGISLSNATTLNGTGANSNGALENVAGNNTLSGALTIASAALVESDSASNLTLSGAVGLGANTLTVGGGGNTTVSNAISGTGGLTKSDAGTLTLTGTNGYTGATTISGGILQVGNGGTTGSLGTGGAVTDNGTLIFNRNNAMTVANAISGNGTITQAGTGTTTLSGTNSGFTGAINVNSGTLVAQGGNTALGSASGAGVTVASGATLQLNGGVSVANGTLTIGGTGVSGGGALVGSGGNNTLAGNITLTANTTITNNYSTGSLDIGKTSTAYNRTNDPTGTPTDASTLSLGSNNLTFNGTGTIFADARMTGTGGVTINMTNATDTVWFTANQNTYTGTTTVAKGTLGLATLYNYPTDLLTSHPGYYAFGGNLVIGDGAGTAGEAKVSIQSGTSFAEMMNSATLVTINSDGLLSLNNAQTISGLTFNGGQVSLGSSGTLYLNGDVTVNALAGQTATIGGTGILDLTRHVQTPGTHDVRTFNVVGGVGNTSDLTISAIVRDGGITKNGAGTMTMTGTNTYELATTVNNGILNIQNASALGAANNDDASGTTVSGNGTTNGTLQLQGGITVSNEKLTLNNTGFNNNGALQNVSGNNTWTGSVVLASNSRVQSDSGLLTISGAVTSTNNSTLTVGGVSTTKISGTIGTGTGGVIKNDTGTLILSGSNTYSGATTVNGGILSVQSNNALGAVSGTTTVNSGAAVYLDNTSIGGGANALTVNAEPISINGTGVSSSGALHNESGANTFQGSVSLAGSSLITAKTGTSMTLSGTVATAGNALQIGNSANSGNITVNAQITGGGSLTKDGTGNLTFGGSNATTGTVGQVTLNGGAGSTLTVGDGSHATTLNATGLTTTASTTLMIASGGKVDVNGNATFASNSISSSSSGILQIDGSGTATQNTLTFNGTISASNLTLNLNGTTTGAALYVNLAGANVTVGTINITGNTILDFGNSAGTILSSAILNIAGNATVTVKNWETIANQAGNSTIWYLRTGGNATVGTGGELDPGNVALTGTNYTGAPLNQITFSSPSGSIGSTTTWVDDTSQGWFDHEIRPTPEPATYGAIFVSGCLGLVGFLQFRRRKATGTRKG